MKLHVHICRIIVLSLLVFGGYARAYAQTAQENATYRVEVDLINIENDRVKIRVFPPKLGGDTAVYRMPRIVPGTYSISDFGRFVSNFEAFDADGKSLNVSRLDTNQWAIVPADRLHYISYLVDDTFDDPTSGIFAPGGTGIEAGEYVIFNAFGFVGYFRDAKNLPFELVVERPGDFHGETTLNRLASDSLTDRFSAENYFELHDCPILYARPDTTSIFVGETRISVAVYSANNLITAVDVMDVIGDLFPATAEYLGGELPTDKYAVLLYLTDDFGMMAGMGALEHHTSTVAVMPEWPLEGLAQTLVDLVAHEFLHIVTPLNIHSEYVADYDFIDPGMSEHLWLFEGVTEYTAHHVQVKQGLITKEAFLNGMAEKIMTASQYKDDLSFTDLSRNVLDRYANQFGNVYMKGALIGMALDLKLLQLTDGKYGLPHLMADLMERFGQDQPFEDARLFEIIGEISKQPEIVGFLEAHVGGAKPLPLVELLGNAGVLYAETRIDTVTGAGNLGVGYNPRSERMIVVSTNKMDAFGQAMGFRDRDELIEWNGHPVTMDNYYEVMATYRREVRPGDPVEVKISRRDENGEAQIHTLRAPALSTTVEEKNVVELIPSPTPQQMEIRRAWLGH